MDKLIGKLVVVTGFSGSGKDTLINLFLQKRSDFDMIITHSTRPQRPGEIPGVHHHFVNYREFQTLVKKGEMLEYVKYGSFYKGTSIKEFERIHTGKNLIWRIDILRAATYEDTFFQTFDNKTAKLFSERSLRLFIKTPSFKNALTRYKKRDIKNANISEFEKRLKRDIEIFQKYEHKFPNIIVNKNGRLHDALAEMEKIVDSYSGNKN